MNPDAFKILSGTRAYGGTWYSMKVPSPNFANIPKFLNGTAFQGNAVAVGTNGNSVGGCTIAVINKNNPFTWTVVPTISTDTGVPNVSNNYALNNVVYDSGTGKCLLIGKNCYVILALGYPDQITVSLYKTSVAMPAADPLSLNAVQYLDGKMYCVGSAGAIYTSYATSFSINDNGGYFWTKRTSNTTDNLVDIYVRDTSISFAVGNKSFLRSDDGGQTWTNFYASKIQVLTDPSGYGIQGLNKIFYCGGSNWLLAATSGSGNGGALLLSRNNCDSWVFLADFYTKNSYDSYGKIKNIFQLYGLVYVTTEAGMLFVSETSNLVTWQRINNIYANFYKDCVFRDLENGKIFSLSNNSYSVSM